VTDDPNRNRDPRARRAIGKRGDGIRQPPPDRQMEKKVDHPLDPQPRERARGRGPDARQRCRIGEQGVEPVRPHRLSPNAYPAGSQTCAARWMGRGLLPAMCAVQHRIWSDGVPSKEAVKRARWRAHHRGTREADMLVGGFCDRWIAHLDPEEFDWFERLLAQQDVDILAWAFGKAEAPAQLEGPLMDRLRALDYIRLPGR
jgi:antitoxin CptB